MGILRVYGMSLLCLCFFLREVLSDKTCSFLAWGTW